MIPPTVGRVLYYRPSYRDNLRNDEEPHAAIVVMVREDGSLNLAVFDRMGRPHDRQNVPLVQGDAKPPENRSYCHWMPFQIAQAQKTESAEADLKARIENLEAKLSALAEQLPRGEVEGKHPPKKGR